MFGSTIMFTKTIWNILQKTSREWVHLFCKIVVLSSLVHKKYISILCLATLFTIGRPIYKNYNYKNRAIVYSTCFCFVGFVYKNNKPLLSLIKYFQWPLF